MFINSNIIENLINNKKLRLTQKNQKVNGENYFFNPQLNIKLYNTRIIDIQEKFIIIEFIIIIHNNRPEIIIIIYIITLLPIRDFS